MFKNIKRIISQCLETEYWYRFRKITHYWFNDDINKYIKCDKRSYPYKARDILTSTWEGRTDLWYSMLLKIDHMFWNLHKYGNEANYYFYSSDVEKYANKNDKLLLAKKVIELALFDDKRLFPNRLWLFSEKVNKSFSDNEKVDFALQYFPKENILSLVANTNELIPANQIKKKNKLYTLSSYTDEDGKKQFTHKEAKQYRKNNIETIDSWDFNKLGVNTLDEKLNFVLNNVDFSFLKIDSYCLNKFQLIPEKHPAIQDIALDEMNQYCPDFRIEEIPLLSKKLKTHACGNFKKCQQLLHLRHLIKKLINVCNDDMKYDYLWANYENEEQRKAGMKEAIVHYDADRKAAYYEVADYMIKFGERWWD